MKILIIANNAAGLYAFRQELICELIKIADVYIALPQGIDLDQLIEMGCKFIETKLDRHGMNPFTDAKLVMNYISIIRNVKPDVVLTYTVKPNVYGGMACQIVKVPYITNITGLGTSLQSNNILSKIVTLLYKTGLRKASSVFFQNEANQRFMLEKGIVKGKHVLIPGSGVNLEKNQYEKYPPTTDNVIFLVIGRIMKDKGTDEVLMAAKEIKRDYPNVQFKIIGKYEEDYKEKIEKAVERGDIEYLGYRDDVHNLLAKSHATINASYHEGMSNVLLETAAAGRPIIASDIPGCKEAVDNGITGYLFPVKDVTSLIHCIQRFLSLSDKEKENMGFMGRKKMESEFDRNIVIEKYLTEIKTITKRK